MRRVPRNPRDFLKQSRFLVAQVRSLRQLRDEAKARWWVRQRPRRIGEYLNRSQRPALQLGCGFNVLEGWLNTDTFQTNDVVYLDSTQPFPLPSASFDAIFSEHHIEHMPYVHAQWMLRECCRILKPGGILRIATPSLDRLRELKQPDDAAYIEWMVSRLMPGVESRQAYNFGHQFLYDRATLQESLRAAGFDEMNEFRPTESATPWLQNLEQHGKRIGNEEMNAFETMVIEARKPPQS
jgi:predicted SAM-dependent methyltransferase